MITLPSFYHGLAVYLKDSLKEKEINSRIDCKVYRSRKVALMDRQLSISLDSQIINDMIQSMCFEHYHSPVHKASFDTFGANIGQLITQ